MFHEFNFPLHVVTGHDPSPLIEVHNLTLDVNIGNIFHVFAV